MEVLVELIKGAAPAIAGSIAIAFALIQTLARFYSQYIKLRRERLKFESERKELSETIVNSLSLEEKNREEVVKRIDAELLRAPVPERPPSWAANLADSRERLTDEILSLRNSGRSHLLYGLAFSLFSLSALGVFAFVQNGQSLNEFVSRELLYRLGFALLLQTVGFFFLRLYVKNQVDIKYYNNELTNLDAREAGIRLALERKGSVAKLVDSLSKTERNFILKKGESSIFDDNRNYVENLAEKIWMSARSAGGK
ncbi:hypothetical protein [Bradyrhizobium sp. Y36]|uniref:hypothetical protein n=1 Tax=Bradyrhizobium sp. Y36 TaxID=2035447 RepID=UPI001177FE3D|nr:hypothetical protein [Bradyrhizobium sp. Y36]